MSVTAEPVRQELLPIREIARKLGISDEYLEPCSAYGAKLRLALLKDPKLPPRGKLILVTATTPTKSGEGKTVTSIGLTQGLAKIGKRPVITSREPSLGPVFGIKGGAAGGGLSQIHPGARINLHFHGDFHAITSAHNLLAALVDAHLFHGNELNLDTEQITWPRTMDMNDRALRRITVGRGSKQERASGFVITAASEVMAIMALASGLEDLRKRLGSIVVGFNVAGKPIRAQDLDAVGGMMALLSEALMPNLVQTTEGVPAMVHTGPFGNIAHGTSSVVSQSMGLRLADYVVNECGFASDLGAEKYFDIVMRTSGIKPSAAVLVTTARSLKEQGEGDMERGFANLKQHVAILRGFGVPIVAAINRFPDDTDADLGRIAEYCGELGVAYSFSEGYTKGGAGTADLAEKVVAAADQKSDPKSLYPLDTTFEDKIQTLAKKVYGADSVEISYLAHEKLKHFAELGFGNLPICIAKTQASLSDDPKLMGAPKGWTLRVTDANLSAGAGFVVVVAGNMMLMPGLPKMARGSAIDVDADGNVLGVG
jgi:formate--tetrahydrofolate ligase